LTSRELLALMRGLAGLPIIGADVVEVAPAYDHAQITALAATHVAYELVSVIALKYGRGNTGLSS
jgi:agmatinase